ncbi:uncharacterized protein LOC135846721 [Planococcus citri]|uniref:uncharacterized protein LOC135846721 n=1 Tax=Planococcus citri TaxID=170843 RepID=UPI0031F83CCD
MPVITYESENRPTFQHHHLWNSEKNHSNSRCEITINSDNEDSTFTSTSHHRMNGFNGKPSQQMNEECPNQRMQRAASIAYTSDTHQSEQPLLHFFLPNKVEYYCNTNRDQFSKINVPAPIANPRRHSSGNCNAESDFKKQISPVPPPVPARVQKAPAIPERKNIRKSQDSPSPQTPPPASTFAKTNNIIPSSSSSSSTVSTSDPSSSSTTKTTTSTTSTTTCNITVKLPPPPQSTSKRGSFSRTNATAAATSNAAAETKEPVENCDQTGAKFQAQRTDPQQKLQSNAFTEVKTLTPLQNAALFNNLQNKSTAEEGYFKFPKVSTPTSSNPDDSAETFSSVRRKSGKKIPPPIHTYTNQVIDDADSPNFGSISKMSVRHDSTLSCSDGGISQTSSPSYLIRSLESPLLPKVKTHSTNRHSKRKFITDKLFSDINEFAMPKDNKNLSPPDLTKSQSTPGGLQTVVDYQQGANLPYQHKVIRNEKSTSYLSRSELKFQFVQIVINVIVLLAVAGALACYFRAYPTVTTVKYINYTTINVHNISHRPVNTYYAEYHHAVNEFGFYCFPLAVRFCLDNHVPYNYTMLPNFFNTGEHEAEMDLESFEAITNVRCYQLASLFLCSLYSPKCGLTGERVKPCRSLCLETQRRCGIFLEIFGLQFPEKFDCSWCPSHNSTEECIGHNEMKLFEEQESIAACVDGFKCDQRRCIPQDWRCDGHIDCEDETDELNCKQCPGQLHCGMGQCIATSHICDGVLNCPWGQDERNCVRLDEQMGDVGSGNVEVFVAEDKAFRTACIREWDQQNSPQLICELLGYKYLNHTDLQNKSENTQIQYIQYNKENVEKNKIMLFHDLKNCQNNGHYPTVRALCSSYECGVRKQSLGYPSTRIVGGVPSNPGDWPFLAAILGGPMEIFYCAGVLISDQWVMSAAHCVGHYNLSHPPLDWTIQLGMTRRSSHSYFGQKLKIKRVIPHPEYNVGVPHDNDIALFQLRDRVKFHDHLLPVCMPNATTTLEPPRNCTVIGWGKREDNEISDYEPTVYEVQVPILSRQLCNTWLRKRNLNVSPGMICAGYEHGGKDACQGDSGGPLLCQHRNQPDRWFVGGIVSWGIKCAHPHLPGIYANVPRFVPWIEEQMKMYKDERRFKH